MKIQTIAAYLKKNIARTEILSNSHEYLNGTKYITKNPHIVEFYNSEGKRIGEISKIHGGGLNKFFGVCTTITTFSDKLKRNFQKVIKQYSNKIQILDKSGDILVIPERTITDIKEIDFEKGITKKIRKIRELKTPHELDKEYPNFAQIYKLHGKAKYSEEIIEELEEPYISHKRKI